jgi:MerR HTH family regulatory protein
MPVTRNGVPVPTSESTQRAIVEARRRADSIGVRAAAQILGVDVRTLRRWHRDGVGPKRRQWWKRTRPTLYSRAEVEKFAASRKGKRLGRVQPSANGHSEAERVQAHAEGHSEVD